MANAPFDMGNPPVKGLFEPDITEDPKDNPVTNPDPIDFAQTVGPQPVNNVNQNILGSPGKFRGNRLGYKKIGQ